MKYTVYKITCQINGKIYIGKHQTENLDDGYMGSGKLIGAAIKKHGVENFSKEILHVFETEEEMNSKEAELVVLGEHTYNVCPGGKGGWGYVNATIEPSRKRIAQRLGGMATKGKANSKVSAYLDGWYMNASTVDKNRRIKGLLRGGTHTKGMIFINDGSKNKMISGNEKLPDGWKKGRIKAA